MEPLQRIGGSSVAAIGITFGLTAMMAAMITVEFTAAEKEAVAKFEINPTAQDIPPLERRIIPKALKKVETPPAPPKLDVTPTGPVSVGPNELIGGKMDYTIPRVELDIPPITVSDTNATPILRPKPIMPPRADRSGHCKVLFDVTPEGRPFNIQTPYCSDNIFKRTTVSAVKKWRFTPKRQNGQAVTMTGVRNQITFRLEDERGHPIPE